MEKLSALIKKEFVLEFRQKSSFFGVILYVVSTIFVCYQSFGGGKTALNIDTWNALFWIIVLFASLNAINKSFLQDANQRYLLYYSLVKPEMIMLSKLIYNTVQLIVLSALAFFIYHILFDFPIADLFMFLLVLGIGAMGLSACFTLISGIAAKAANNISLMAILSFPVIIPIIILVLKLSRNAIDGLDWSVQWGYLLPLLGINVILITLSFLLFPFLWRS